MSNPILRKKTCFDCILELGTANDVVVVDINSVKDSILRISASGSLPGPRRLRAQVTECNRHSAGFPIEEDIAVLCLVIHSHDNTLISSTKRHKMPAIEYHYRAASSDLSGFPQTLGPVLRPAPRKKHHWPAWLAKQRAPS